MPLLQQVRDEVAVMQPAGLEPHGPHLQPHLCRRLCRAVTRYKWAEVLSADAYAALEETAAPDGTPSKDTGQRYLRCICEGRRQPPRHGIVRAFRGRAPDLAALLRHQGMAA